MWVISGSVRDTLLSWMGLLVGKKTEKGVASETIMFIMDVLKARNGVSFRDKLLLIQKIKVEN